MLNNFEYALLESEKAVISEKLIPVQPVAGHEGAKGALNSPVEMPA